MQKRKVHRAIVLSLLLINRSLLLDAVPCFAMTADYLETKASLNTLANIGRDYSLAQIEQSRSGMNYIVLSPYKSFSEQVKTANTIYEIRNDFSLGNKTVIIPDNCVLLFRGGLLKDGTLGIPVSSSISAPPLVQLFDNIQFPLTNNENYCLTPKEIHTSWFGIKDGGNYDSVFEKLLNYLHYRKYGNNYGTLYIDTDLTLYRPIKARCVHGQIKGLSNVANTGEHVRIKSSFDPKESTSLIHFDCCSLFIEGIGFEWNVKGKSRSSILTLKTVNYGERSDLDSEITNCVFRYYWDVSAISTIGRGIKVSRCSFSNTHQNNYGQYGDIHCYTAFQDLNDPKGSYAEDQMRHVVITDNRFHVHRGHFCLALDKGEDKNSSPFKGVVFNNNYSDSGNGLVIGKTWVDGLQISNNVSMFCISSLISLEDVRGVQFTNNTILGTGRDDGLDVGNQVIFINPNDKTKNINGLIISNNVFFKNRNLGVVYVTSNPTLDIPLKSVLITNNAFVNSFGGDGAGLLYLTEGMKIDDLLISNNTIDSDNKNIYGLYIKSSSSQKQYRNIRIHNNPGCTNSIYQSGKNKHLIDTGNWINVVTESDGRIQWDGSKRVEYDGATYGIKRYGTFRQKPNAKDIYIGFKYFCTDRQTIEGKTNGIEIIHKGNDVWVDALGRTIK